MFIKKILNKIFISKNVKIINKIKNIVSKINYLEHDIKKLSDKKLQDKTNEFKFRLKQGEKLKNLLPEAFAVVRESSKRIFNMRHYDVQILGGIILHDRCIAEMRTGEGKTLTSTLPAYLNALKEKGVHIVTVNDYLAQRDAEINKKLFNFLGMSVGVNLPNLSMHDKRKAYCSDITYGTNNEYGFDYLRDNMVFDPQDKVQRGLYYALVDEVDSILIDEARTPLVISAPDEDSSDLYIKINKIIPCLLLANKKIKEEKYFSIDEKLRQVYLTENGLVHIEKLLIKNNILNQGESLYSSKNIMLMHHVTAALRAHILFVKNIDYIVNNNEVIIVDVHTGRIMKGRRWSDGLHQAIEAKENLKVQKENQTLASITFQNYFRLYKKLAGMTGTASTEEHEFKTIYKLNTIVVPTNRPMIRIDLPDLIYMTEKEKIKAIIKDIQLCIKKKQPVLVGTISIEKSEIISYKLKKLGIQHKVLNAKLHKYEAEIIAQAGKPGSVTIATNMAGRGTDIVLGGCWKTKIVSLKNITNEKIYEIKKAWKIKNKKVILCGGLHIIGTERHESRRIDNQLRGRAGRQGDPGSSRFYLSMEDSMMRIFASERISSIMKKLGMKQDESIEHPWITKAIANAQSKVENYNFDIRKQLLEYDDVTNDQRKVIYEQRDVFLYSNDLSKIIHDITEEVIKKIINKYIPKNSITETWDVIGLITQLKNDFEIIDFDEKSIVNMTKEEISRKISFKIHEIYLQKENIIGKKLMRKFEKNTILSIFDNLWKEHLLSIEYLRQGIHLRGYAQKDPKQEYKRESFLMFQNMIDTIQYELITTLCKIKFTYFNDNNNKNNNIIEMNFLLSKKNKIGRNKFCPCNSGKKYKFCHGRIN